jgi:replicative DNA helicase
MATFDISALDRGMPASPEAERTLLGAILLDNDTCNEAAEILRPDDFHLSAHRQIFSAMMVLHESGRSLDIVTISEELARKKELETVGGVAYLSSLMDGVPHLPSVMEYAKIIKDKSLLRALINASQGAIARAMDQSVPAEEVIESAESEIFKVAEDRIGQGFYGVSQIVDESFGSIDNLLKRGQKITGLETHFERLDEMTSGLQKSELIIIAGRPSMGKTAFAINIAENAAVMGHKTVAVFSLEMSRESLLLRMLSSQARVDSHNLRRGFLSRDDMGKLGHALNDLMSAPVFIDDTPGISLSEMRAKCRRLQKAQGNLDLIVVDYLQLMSAAPVGGKQRYENRTQEVSAISRGLKALAKEMKVPVVALSQLSRAPESRSEKGKPQLSDLRESGAIEQDADVVAFIFREEYYKPEDPELEGRAEVIIAKQRNGPTGTVKLAFVKSSTRFENMAPGMDTDEQD